MLQADLRQHFEVPPQSGRPVAQSGTAAIAQWRGDNRQDSRFMSWVGYCVKKKISVHLDLV